MAADGAFEEALPRLIERLDEVVIPAVRLREGDDVGEELDLIGRDGSAPSRIRPRLGQPVSPIRIGLPGGSSAWTSR